MGKNSVESKIRTAFRNSDRSNNPYKAFQELGVQKRRTPPSRYHSLISIYRISSPKSYAFFSLPGKKRFDDLLWFPGVDKVSLSKEIAFCTEWLLRFVDEINSFLTFSKDVESYILDGEFDKAIIEVESFIKKNGWSVWKAEIMFFLVGEKHGFEKLREYSESLVEDKNPRIASLLAKLLLDRNNRDYSVDAFYAKWRAAFSHIGLSGKAQNYLSYRAITQVDDLENGLADSLSYDLNNSIYDCYETLIDTCSTALIEEFSQEVKIVALEALSRLHVEGFKDSRINQLVFLEKGCIKNLSIDKSSFAYNLFLDQGAKCCDKISKELSVAINDIEEKKEDIEDGLNAALFYAINMKVINLGQNILALVARSNEGLVSRNKSLKWLVAFSKGFSIEYVAALSETCAIQLLQDLSSSENEFSELSRGILELIENKSSKVLDEVQISPSLAIWLGVALLQNKSFTYVWEVYSYLCKVEKGGGKDSKNLKLLILKESDDLESALSFAVSEVACKESLGRLLVSCIFENEKWKSFNESNYIDVAILSHCAYLQDNNSNTLYICRMACRKLFKSDILNSFELMWYREDQKGKEKLKYYFKEVFVERNLSLADLESSHEVRRVRIKALQILFTVDSDNSKSYAEEIKQLTVTEKLWLGLSYINESRVFVNESAIARWAERELAHDFLRWQKEYANTDTESFEEALYNYLNDENTEKFISGLNKKKNESNVLLVSIVERLLEKFLSDPEDGLDTYLSSRIRHGSLKGTIMGPMEEARLIGNHEFNDSHAAPQSIISHDPSLYRTFNKVVNNIEKEVEWYNSNLVRVKSSEFPNGIIDIVVNKVIASQLFPGLAKDSTLQMFIEQCFEVFWSALDTPLKKLNSVFSNDIKSFIQNEFDSLVEELDVKDDSHSSLISLLREVSTNTQAQCDVVASWFLADEILDKRLFTLSEAIDIALKSTQNVYRLFNASLKKFSSDALNLKLTVQGLTTIADCLYVIFENAWKHSGLSSQDYDIEATFDVNEDHTVLTIQVSNPLSEGRYHSLTEKGILEKIEVITNDGPSLNLIGGEGGSGMHKLARLVSKSKQPDSKKQFYVDVTNDRRFSLTISIPLYRRGEGYDLYFQ